MEINIRSDSIEITGYVNAIERNSKPLISRIGRFVERVRKGAFANALKRNSDVLLLLNHDPSRVLGSQKQGNLELEEDNIGLHARAIVTDPEVIQSARNGDLVGWSFGFLDTADGVEMGIDDETNLPLRRLRDLDLREVSILDRTRIPAYDGTLVMARSDDDVQFWGEAQLGDVQIREEKIVDLTPYWDMVDEMYGNLLEKRYNPNHGKDGRFTAGTGTGGSGGSGSGSGGSGRKAGRKYGETDTSDAVKEIRKGTSNSLEAHMDSNGKLSAEREQIHKDIIDRELDGKVPVDGQPTMTMLGGGPASGKSSVMSTSNLDEHTVKVDPDAMKEALPNYSELAKVDSNTASYYHEESSALAKRLAETSYTEGYDVIYDGTGDGSIDSVEKKIASARQQGYRVEGKYVTIDTDEAVARNQKRYEDAVAKGKNPRLVPEEYVRSCHAKVTDISVATAPKFDYIEIWDNNGGKGEQKLIAVGGNGKYLTPVKGQEQAFNDYLSKGAKGLAGFFTLPDGQVVPVESEP